MNWFRNIFKNGGKGEVSINGQTYTGNTISINNGSVYVDGDLVGGAGSLLNVPKIEVYVMGDCDSVDAGSGNITVAGAVGSADTGSGNISVTGDINGDCDTGSGNITCKGSIAGKAKTGSGNIKSGK